MGSRNDFDEIIRPDENDIFIADTDPFDRGNRSSIAIISGNHERMEFPSERDHEFVPGRSWFGNYGRRCRRSYLNPARRSSR